ncbi:alpha/beta hydrolase [Streptomyces californicus]|uniref:alpha/beta hydrolase n=1 Tax=Streptomyces californicus TaxID=67351 RepID=UPI0033F4DBAC
MQITSEQRHDDGVLERAFTLGETPGTLWTPGENVGSGPLPLVLMSHNNGLPMADPRLTARARYTAARGYAVATIDAADCGDRPRTAAHEQARADLRRAMEAGEPVDELFESLVGPMVENAVPEWLAVLDALLVLPGIHGPVGYSGGWAALGIRLAAVEPRIVAAGFFAGGYVPRAQREEARRLTIPLLFLLQWDDTGNPRQRALDLFDSFGGEQKTLHANVGGHTGTPWFELEDGCRFLDRHLKEGGAAA